jgi:hypothetical protein
MVTSPEIVNETKAEVLLRYLKRERIEWLGYRAIALRSKGFDGHATRNQANSMGRIDIMLDGLFELGAEDGSER